MAFGSTVFIFNQHTNASVNTQIVPGVGTLSVGSTRKIKQSIRL
jgi:hypothetical protein